MHKVSYQLISNPEAHSTWSGFFYSGEWQHLLRSAMGAEPVFFSPEDSGMSHAITIFSRGPFRVAYVNFPFGICNNELFDIEALKNLLSGCQPKPQLLVISSLLKLPDSDHYLYAVTPETSIMDLQNHTIESLKNLRISLRRGHNRGAIIKKSQSAEYSDQVFDLYSRTLSLRGAIKKYSAEYFRQLMMIDKSSLATFLAFVEGQFVGFLMVAVHDHKAIAMHSSYDRNYNRYCIIDMLMEAAVSYARQNGCIEFNMGSSPPDQPGLIEFKEKWGGQTSPLYNYEIPLNSLMAFFFRLARKLAVLGGHFKLLR